MGATRRQGETELPIVFGGLVEVPNHDHGVVDTDDVLEGHCSFPTANANFDLDRASGRWPCLRRLGDQVIFKSGADAEFHFAKCGIDA
ncbi:hypothetical protein BJS_06070 [Bradyrhizobium japonicum SEMIA 5079]|nr:hypothetical protein BJS_06070 [Bradyrhizobium japonicum SEMIA 5079]